MQWHAAASLLRHCGLDLLNHTNTNSDSDATGTPKHSHPTKMQLPQQTRRQWSHLDTLTHTHTQSDTHGDAMQVLHKKTETLTKTP